MKENPPPPPPPPKKKKNQGQKRARGTKAIVKGWELNCCRNRYILNRKNYLHWQGVAADLYSQQTKLLLTSCNINYPRKNPICLKVVSATFLLVCFVCLTESVCEMRKMFFISLWKLFLFLRYTNFKFSDIQMSWCHQMPKHETRTTFYWITWKVNTVE